MRLPDDVNAVSEARNFARRWAAAQPLPPSAAAAIELVVDELVTNAVIHAAPPFQVAMTTIDGAIHGEVSDNSSTAPTPKPPSDDGGFGLRIVDAHTNRWGYTPKPGGKTVWFDIDLRRYQ